MAVAHLLLSLDNDQYHFSPYRSLLADGQPSYAIGQETPSISSAALTQSLLAPASDMMVSESESLSGGLVPETIVELNASAAYLSASSAQ